MPEGTKPDRLATETKQMQLGTSSRPTPNTTALLDSTMTIFPIYPLFFLPKTTKTIKEHTNQGFWAAPIQIEQGIFGSQRCPKTAPQFP